MPARCSSALIVITVRGIEADRHLSQADERAHHQAGADQQHRSDSASCAATSNPRVAAAPRDDDGSCLSIPVRSSFVACKAGTRPNSRELTSDTLMANAATPRSMPICSRRGSSSRRHLEQSVDCPLGDEQAERRADDPEHNALGRELRDEARARGADRPAHRQLAAAGARACQQQVRQVRAGDEQHEPPRRRTARPGPA